MYLVINKQYCDNIKYTVTINTNMNIEYELNYQILNLRGLIINGKMTGRGGGLLREGRGLLGEGRGLLREGKVC